MTAKLDLYKVDANFHGDTIVHTTGVVEGPRAAVLETTWKRTGIIGAGGFGVVWQEKAEGSEQVRAVKVIPKIGLNTQEVKALVEVQDVQTHRARVSDANRWVASEAFRQISVLVRGS